MNIRTDKSKRGVQVPETISEKQNLNDTARLFDGPLGIRSISLTGLFVLACFYTVYLARDFFLPVMLAIVFNFLLAPLVRLLHRYRIPDALGAALVVGIGLVSIGFLAFQLSGPFADWLEKVPETGAKIQAKAQPVRAILNRCPTQKPGQPLK